MSNVTRVVNWQLTRGLLSQWWAKSGVRWVQVAAVNTEHAVENDEEWQLAKPYEEIPGPKPYPIVGNLWRFLPGIGDIYDENFVNVHEKLNSRYGDVVKVSNLPGRRDLLFLFNPDDIAKMLRSEMIWPVRPGLESLTYYRTVTRRDFFEGKGGLLTDHGQDWQDTRTQVNPVLMQTRVVQVYASRINDVAEDFVQRIPEWLRESNEMPESFMNELHKWALESIAVIALDTRLGCLDPNLAPDSEPQRMINSVHNMFKCLHLLETRTHIWKHIPTKTWREFVKTIDYFIEVAMKHITRNIEETKIRGPREDASVLERFLARDPNPKRAVVMALDMLFAGVDTTSYTVANTLLYLAANQDKHQKLYEELERILPDPKTQLTVEMLNEMKYLKAVIKEGMRLQPIVSANARRTTKEVVLANYRVPKEVDVILVNAYLCRMDRYYPDALKFIPERWLREKDDSNKDCPATNVKTNAFTFLPFGHGARKCVGMRFASLEMEMLLAKLVRRFKWENHHGEMKYKSSLIQTPASPLRFTVTTRK